MKGPKPKAPKEARADVEQQIRSHLDRFSTQDAIDMLLPFFTTIDLIGIRDHFEEGQT